MNQRKRNSGSKTTSVSQISCQIEQTPADHRTTNGSKKPHTDQQIATKAAQAPKPLKNGVRVTGLSA
jgi:hypothetical protein